MVINTHDFTSLFISWPRDIEIFFSRIAHTVLSFWAPNSPKRKLDVERYVSFSHWYHNLGSVSTMTTIIIYKNSKE
jgi:hypothetical protein